MKQLIWTTTNFIAPVMVIFLACLAFFLYPRVYQSVGNGSGCQAGKFPTKYEEISMYPVETNWADEDLGPKSQFVKIREEIPVTTDLTAFCSSLFSPNSSDSCVHFMPMTLPEHPNRIILYPGKAAEHDFMNVLTKKPGDFFPLKEKVLFFVHTEGLNRPKILTIRKALGTNDSNTTYEKILLVDAYQEKKRYQEVITGLAGYRYDDVFACDEGGPLPKLTDDQIQTIVATPGFNDPENPVSIPELDEFAANHSQQMMNNIYIPPQSVSPNNEQLQLEWFVFDQSQGAWSSHCKPAVYLYPPQKMSVNVKVFPAGTLTYTDPLYDSKSGWTVDAYPDGKIYDSRYTIYDKPFNYLYFESKVPDSIIKKPTKGWMVRYEDLNSWYYNILPRLGLNALQTKDFADYWNKALQPAPYYFVGIIDQSNVDQIERLEITPKPDSINRVRIYFERLDIFKSVDEPTLPTPSSLNTNHFNVVEWGGMVKNDPNHPFTCSQ